MSSLWFLGLFRVRTILASIEISSNDKGNLWSGIIHNKESRGEGVIKN